MSYRVHDKYGMEIKVVLSGLDSKSSNGCWIAHFPQWLMNSQFTLHGFEFLWSQFVVTRLGKSASFHPLVLEPESLAQLVPARCLQMPVRERYVLSLISFTLTEKSLVNNRPLPAESFSVHLLSLLLLSSITKPLLKNNIFQQMTKTVVITFNSLFMWLCWCFFQWSPR